VSAWRNSFDQSMQTLSYRFQYQWPSISASFSAGSSTTAPVFG